MKTFKDKNVLITGGANGIGKHIAEAFLAQKAKVHILDIDTEKGTALAEAHENATFYNCDLSKKTSINSFFKKFGENIGIDYIINNAAASKAGLLSSCSWEDFEYVQRVGVTGPYYISSVALTKGILSTKSSIVNIASTRAFQSQADTESYSAAKGAILSLTHAMSTSFAGFVRVNSVSPGWIETAEDAKHKPSDLSQHSAGRVGTPSDVAEMVMFLCDHKKSGFITGQNFVVDGGMSKLMIYHGDKGWEYNPNE